MRKIEELIVRKSILIGEKCKALPSVVTFSRIWQQPSITSSIKLYSRVDIFNCLAWLMKEESMIESFGRGWVLFWRTRWTILCIPIELMRMRRC